jgi:hypothetical protein
MGAMLLIGFFAVLVIDVGTSLLGHVRVGQVSIEQLWDKVVDRVLDRDVPRLPPDKASRPRPTGRGNRVVSGDQAAPAGARAPLPAARPEEDARHTRPPERDVQVEHAQKRLDDLLKRL